MKRIYYSLFAAAIIFTSCQLKQKNAAVVEQDAVKASVIAVLEKYSSAMKAKDVNLMMEQLAENGLYCGTDPQELYDKKTLGDNLTRMFADSTLNLNYSLLKQEIQVEADGNSAIAVNQALINAISPKIQVRSVYHLVKTTDKWLIDFFSLGLIPNNQDLDKLNKAME